MCEYFFDKGMQPKVADRDITTYKVVRLSKDKKTWNATYQYYNAPINKLLTAEGDFNPETHDEWMSIGSGMFHSCYDIQSLRKHLSNGVVAVKCIIPKGTKYYCNKIGTGICSKQIIVTNEKVDINQITEPDILEVVEIEDEKYIHVKDSDHEVYLSLFNIAKENWNDAKARFENDSKKSLPSPDDWMFVQRYSSQVDKLIIEHEGDTLGSWFWSGVRYSNYSAWYYTGFTKIMYYGDRCAMIVATRCVYCNA